MKIKRVIRMCLNCENKEGCYTPSRLYHGRYWHRCKAKDNREIKDATTIPDWCPLKDYKGKE